MLAPQYLRMAAVPKDRLLPSPRPTTAAICGNRRGSRALFRWPI